jgi:hypothetical protein
MSLLDKLWPNRPTPVKDKAEELALKGLGAVFVASFLGTLLALKGCG